MRTQVALLSHSSPDQILNVIDELENAARTRLAFAAADYGLRTIIQLGMRYLGQGFDIAVEVPAGKPDLVALGAAFHAAHERMYGFSREDQPVELVSIWVSVEVDLGMANLPEVNALNVDLGYTVGGVVEVRLGSGHFALVAQPEFTSLAAATVGNQDYDIGQSSFTVLLKWVP